jgi:DNA-binding LytR/AlgR family response regulator
MLNCIILDEKESSKIIEGFVADCSSLNLVGIFNDSTSVLNHLRERHNTDLAIIDIQIAGKETIDKIASLDNPPDIIGVSSDGQYAVEAFVCNFVDYLIKPVSNSRFYRAVDKAIRYYSHEDFNYGDDTEIFIKKDSSLVKLNMKDITYIEALENYVILYTRDKKYTIHFTMKGIERQLPPDNFLRVHRSFIVNKRQIKTIRENNLQLMLNDNLIDLPIGKTFKDLIMNDICVMNK